MWDRAVLSAPAAPNQLWPFTFNLLIEFTIKIGSVPQKNFVYVKGSVAPCGQN